MVTWEQITNPEQIGRQITKEKRQVQLQVSNKTDSRAKQLVKKVLKLIAVSQKLYVTKHAIGHPKDKNALKKKPKLPMIRDPR